LEVLYHIGDTNMKTYRFSTAFIFFSLLLINMIPQSCCAQNNNNDQPQQVAVKTVKEKLLKIPIIKRFATYLDKHPRFKIFLALFAGAGIVATSMLIISRLIKKRGDDDRPTKIHPDNTPKHVAKRFKSYSIERIMPDGRIQFAGMADPAIVPISTQITDPGKKITIKTYKKEEGVFDINRIEERKISYIDTPGARYHYIAVSLSDDKERYIILTEEEHARIKNLLPEPFTEKDQRKKSMENLKIEEEGEKTFLTLDGTKTEVIVPTQIALEDPYLFIRDDITSNQTTLYPSSVAIKSSRQVLQKDEKTSIARQFITFKEEAKGIEKPEEVPPILLPVGE
jgi:hypothetical protein